ncbi:hypothetical protein ACM55M_06835 [Flavobacterium sp. ZT3R25]|uniref:hypothetical protein n=1 Tax=Flavobacterium galactosi TaxID=3398735 RepID=UPI003A8A457C
MTFDAALKAKNEMGDTIIIKKILEFKNKENMEIEILKYKEGKIYIEYMNNLDNLKGYLDGTFVYAPLNVTFIPDVVMTENQCLNFLKYYQRRNNTKCREISYKI